MVAPPLQAQHSRAQAATADSQRGNAAWARTLIVCCYCAAVVPVQGDAPMDVLLRARVCCNAEGLDMGLYRVALSARRRFLAEEPT